MFFGDDMYLKELVERFLRIVNEGVISYIDANEWEEILEYYEWGMSVDDKNYSIALSFALKQYPDDIKFRIRKVRENIQDELYDLALVNIHDVIVDEPTSEAFLIKAEIFRKKGLFELEKKACFDAIKHSVSKVETYSEIAWKCFSDDRVDDAIYYFKKAYRLFPENSEILKDLSLAYESSQFDQEALEFFTDFTNKYPYSKEGWHQLGKACFRLDLDEQALDAYDFALAIEPKDSEILLSKAVFFRFSGKYNDAINTLSEIRKGIYVDDVNLLFAECYEKLEQYDLAIKRYKKIIDENDDIAEIWKRIGFLYEKLQKQQQAIFCLRKAISLNVDEPNLLMEIGLFFKRQDLFDDAINVFEDIAVLEPNWIEPLIEISDIYMLQNKFKESVLTLNKVIELDDENADIIFQIAGQNFKSGNFKECYKFLEKGMTLNPKGFVYLLEKYPEMEDDPIVIDIIDNDTWEENE